jgi:hypothetical protein
MAGKKYATTEILDSKGKPAAARGIDASNETVTVKGPDNQDVEKRITDVIVEFVNAADQEKTFKEKKEAAGELVRKFITDVRTFFAKKGEFTKTFRVFGTLTKKMAYALDVSSSDKFSFSAKKEDLANLKRELTAGVFKQIFEEVATISIKKVVMDDDKKRRELTKILLDALGEEKVKEYFEREVVYILNPGLYEKTYQFPAETQKVIRDNFKQAADSIKDASEIVH